MKIKAKIKLKADLFFSNVLSLSYIELVSSVWSSKLNCTLFIFNPSLLCIATSIAFFVI